MLALLDLPRLIDPPTTRPRRRPDRRAASSRPATANRRTTAIAAKVSHTARLSSRWVLSGARSPACSAIVHPLRLGIRLISAAAYLPAAAMALSGQSTAAAAPVAQRASAGPGRYLSWRQQPPPILLSSQTHDREAAAPNDLVLRTPPQVTTQMAAAVLGALLDAGKVSSPF
jgi:hypothetical protein